MTVKQLILKKANKIIKEEGYILDIEDSSNVLSYFSDLDLSVYESDKYTHIDDLCYDEYGCSYHDLIIGLLRENFDRYCDSEYIYYYIKNNANSIQAVYDDIQKCNEYPERLNEWYYKTSMELACNHDYDTMDLRNELYIKLEKIEVYKMLYMELLETAIKTIGITELQAHAY